MKNLLLTICFLLSVYSLSAQQQDTADGRAIKTIVQKQEDAWNQGKLVEKGIVYYAEDATLVNFVGKFLKSKAEIVQNFSKINSDVFKRTSIKNDLKELRFITNDVAIANIQEQFTVEEDYTDAGQQHKKGDRNYKLITYVFVRKNNEWLITSTQLTSINQPISPHQ
jgi:uncharacterized protein (TIGR02246 family)